MPQGSVEYLYVDVTSDVTLSAQPVAMKVAPTVTQGTWLAAEWMGTEGLTRSCRILLDGTLTAGKYDIFVKITDNTEIPIINAGVLRIKVN